MLGNQLLEWTESMDRWPWEKVGLFVVLGLITLFLALLPWQPFFVIDEVHFFFYAFLVFLACLYRPLWVFLLLIAVLPLETTNLLPPSWSIAVRPYQLLTLLLSMALGLELVTKKIKWPLFTLQKIDIGVGVLLLGAFLAVPKAIAMETALKQAVILGSFVLLYVLFRYFLSQSTQLKEYRAALIIGVSVVLVAALGQSIIFILGGNAGMVMEGRPNATFFEADWLGLFVALGALVAFASLWASYKTKRFRTQPLCFVGILLLAEGLFGVLILTVARSAWLALFVGMGVLLLGSVYFLFKNWWRKKVLIRTLVTVLGIILSTSLIIWVTGLTRFDLSNRLTSTATGEQRITVACETPTVLPETIASVAELGQYQCQHIRLEEREAEHLLGKSIQEVNRQDPNFHTRSAIYWQTVEILQAHPFLGIGGGNSSILLGTDERGAGLNASNIFLETWLSFGLLGFLGLVFVLGALGLTLFQEVLRGSEKHLLGLALLVTLVVFNLFNAGMLMGIFFGLLAYLVTLSEEKANAISLPTDFKIL